MWTLCRRRAARVREEGGARRRRFSRCARRRHSGGDARPTEPGTLKGNSYLLFSTLTDQPPLHAHHRTTLPGRRDARAHRTDSVPTSGRGAAQWHVRSDRTCALRSSLAHRSDERPPSGRTRSGAATADGVCVMCCSAVVLCHGGTWFDHIGIVHGLQSRSATPWRAACQRERAPARATRAGELARDCALRL